LIEERHDQHAHVGAPAPVRFVRDLDALDAVLVEHATEGVADAGAHQPIHPQHVELARRRRARRAEDRERGRIGVGDLPGGVGEDDADRHLLDEQPRELLALAQRLLDADALGHVAAVDHDAAHRRVVDALLPMASSST
jgi:hypothetical protein